jgi:hypothetical protein
MNKTKVLLSGVLSLAILYPASSHAQSYTQSQAFGTPPASAPAPAAPVATVATTSSTSSSAGSYQNAHSMLAPISDRILTDPLYLPLHGQIEGISAYTLGLGSSDSYNSTGVDRAHNNSFDNTFDQTVQIGVTDDIAVRAGESYEFGRSFSDSQLSGVDTSTVTRGFSDPTFGATYRFIDQRHNFPVSATVDATYSPDLIPSHTGGTGFAANDGSGRQAGTFTADVGREMKFFTIDALAGTSYDGRRTYEALPSGDYFNTDPAWTYFMGLRSQIRFNERTSVNAGYRYTQLGVSKITNQTTDLPVDQVSPDEHDFNVALNYHFIPNRLVGQFSYDYIDYTGTNDNYVRLTRDTETQNQMDHVIGVRLFYVFN